MEEKITEEIRPLSPEERIPEISELIKMTEERRYSDFRRTVSALPAADIAELFEDLPREYYAAFYRLLPKEAAAEVFVEMHKELQEHIINSFTDGELSATLDELYIDDTVDIIEEMPDFIISLILDLNTCSLFKRHREIAA